MPRKFMYTCAGLLMLAAAYHLGATSARAQDKPDAGPQVAYGMTATQDAKGEWTVLVLTSRGELFERKFGHGAYKPGPARLGNYWFRTEP